MNKSVLYITRRFGFYLIAAFAALTLNFIIPRLMPGDPASIIFARFKGKLKPEAIDAMRESFGLTNDPIFIQYFSYLKSILKGDLGTSIAYFPAPVSEIISNGLGWTIFLAGISMIIAFLIGTTLGIIIAWNRTGKLDTILPPTLAFFGAFPYFWLAMVFLYLFGFSLNWFPIGRAYGNEINPGYNLPFFISALYHAFLPALTLVFGLIHGFGFASVLLELGLPKGKAVSSLFGFNLGVELGQILVVTLAIFTLYVLGKTKLINYKDIFYNVSALLLIALGTFWFVGRVFSL